MATFRRKTVALLTIEHRPEGQSSTRGSRGKKLFVVPQELMLVADVTELSYRPAHPWLDVSDWKEIAKLLVDAYAEVDGFVLLHPTATLASAAAALTCMMTNLEKPVVLLGDDESRASLVNAFQAAVSDVAEVVVLHRLLLLRGAAVHQVTMKNVTSFDGTVLGKVDFGIRLFGQQIHRQRRKFKIDDRFAEGMSSVTVAPGATAAQLLQQIGSATAVWMYLLGSDESLLALVRDVIRQLPSTAKVFVHGSAPLGGQWAKNIIPVVGPVGPMMIRAMWAAAHKLTPAATRTFVREGSV